MARERFGGGAAQAASSLAGSRAPALVVLSGVLFGGIVCPRVVPELL